MNLSELIADTERSMAQRISHEVVFSNHPKPPHGASVKSDTNSAASFCLGSVRVQSGSKHKTGSDSVITITIIIITIIIMIRPVWHSIQLGKINQGAFVVPGPRMFPLK